MNKFRVWCKDRNEWEKDECLLRGDGTLFHRVGNNFVQLLPNNHIIEWFTGLLDKNGVEIFEGDKILTTYDIGDGCDPRGLREKTFTLDTWEAFIEFIFDVGHDAYIELEVIGNIHQPELIESEGK